MSNWDEWVSLEWMGRLEDFRFGHPYYLWVLLVLPLLLYWMGRRRVAPAIGYSSLAGLADLGNRSGDRGGGVASPLLLLALALLISALARPQLAHGFTKVRASGIDILLVLDASSSMLAEDFTIGGERASRLEAVKQVTRQFIESRPNDRMGILAFASKPLFASPLTLDHRWLLENLEDQVEIDFEFDGTAIGSAIGWAANKLDRLESSSRIIVLLTDGTNSSGLIQPLTAAEATAALGIKVYTIGAGSEGMAPVPRMDPSGRITEYDEVKVEFDEETLQAVAAMTGGRYFRATGTDSLQAIYNEIDRLEKSEVEEARYEEVSELFPMFLVPGTLLLLLFLIWRFTVWRRLP